VLLKACAFKDSKAVKAQALAQTNRASLSPRISRAAGMGDVRRDIPFLVQIQALPKHIKKDSFCNLYTLELY
jgi:hypothetical protein